MKYAIEATIETCNFKAKIWRGRVTIEPRWVPALSLNWRIAQHRAEEQLALLARARRIHRQLFGRNPI